MKHVRAAAGAGRFAWLRTSPLAGLLAVIDSDGEEARIVGGAVRNALLDEPVTEWDVATTALPATVTERCLDKGWKVVPTGIEHGTVTVVIDGTPFEVTTLREDVETDGRRAVVRFGRDFRTDALRRDFTINALSLSRGGELHDYANGLDDLAQRRVRFIGSADERIAEDSLYLLRLFRFHARYGRGPIDREGLAASIRGRAGLARLSRERVRAELMKLLTAQGAVSVLSEIDGAGFLLAILGGVARTATFSRLAAEETALGLPSDPLRRLAALSVFILEDTLRLSALLRLSNIETRHLECLALALETLRAQPGEHQARELVYRFGKDLARDILLVAGATAGSRADSGALETAAGWEPPPCPYRGADAARLGLRPGPSVGRLLAEAERRWIEAGFPTDPPLQESILQDAARTVLA